jgi:hypothetical protein
VSIETVIVNDELQRLREEAAEAYFILFPHVAEEDNEKCRSGLPATAPKIEPGNSGIWSRMFASVSCFFVSVKLKAGRQAVSQSASQSYFATDDQSVSQSYFATDDQSAKVTLQLTISQSYFNLTINQLELLFN